MLLKINQFYFNVPNSIEIELLQARCRIPNFIPHKVHLSNRAEPEYLNFRL